MPRPVSLPRGRPPKGSIPPFDAARLNAAMRARGLETREAVRALRKATGLAVTRRSMENWRQGNRRPPPAVRRHLEAMLGLGRGYLG